VRADNGEWWRAEMGEGNELSRSGASSSLARSREIRLSPRTLGVPAEVCAHAKASVRAGALTPTF
jgi:hypothetical protein